MNCYFVEFRMNDLKHKRCKFIAATETKEEVEQKIRNEYGDSLTFLSIARIECNKMGENKEPGKQMRLDEGI